MTQDEINQMVEQAGFHGMLSIGVVMDSKQLETFANLVAQEVRDRIMFGSRDDWVLAEREACAKLVEAESHMFATLGAAKSLAKGIRARGEA